MDPMEVDSAPANGDPAEKSSKHRRHRDDDDKRSHKDKDKDKDKDKERHSKKSSHRDKEERRGDKDSDRHPHKSSKRSSSKRSRSRSPSRRDRRHGSSDRHRESSREREKRRQREREREGSSRRKRSPSRSRSRGGTRRRRHSSRSRSRSRSARRRSDDKRSSSRRESATPAEPAITLETVMRQNPGISLPEAFQKLTFMKAAAAAAAANPAGAAAGGSAATAATQAQLDAAALATAAAAAALGLTASSATASGAPLTGLAAGATRAARELHIGSLPQGMPAPVLHEALNQYLIAQGVGAGTPGNPVVSIRYGGDGHYAFGELRTVQEAVHSLKLGSAQIGVMSVALSRPKGHTDQQVQAAAAAAGVNLIELMATPLPHQQAAMGMLGYGQQQLPGMYALPAAGAGYPAAGVPAAGSVMGSMPQQQQQQQLPALTGKEAAAAAAAAINAKFGMMSSVAAGSGTGGPPVDAAAAAAAAAQAAAVASNRLLGILPEEESNAVMVTNIPLALTAEQVSELLAPFGAHSRFNLLVDATGASKGTAVCEFKENSSAANAAKGLDNISLGGSRLMVQRVPPHVAETLLKKVDIIKKPDETNGVSAAATLTDPSPVMCLSNMVDIKCLQDEGEYNDIIQDVKEECGQYGVVQSVMIPRPDADSAVKVAGLGDIFVEFQDSVGATAAIKGLAGRTFDGAVVKARFFPLQQYMSNNFSSEAPPKPPATAAAATSNGSTSTSTPGFVILNTDADGPPLPSRSAVPAADDDLGEMPDFDTIEVDTFVPTSDDATGAAAANAGRSVAAAVTCSGDANSEAAGGDDDDDYDPFSAAAGDAEVD